ncbi:type I-E CRISPR-associated protein Cse1/CasA [Corynebacterium aquatimens]|uniref:CRISPR system Cascade subunit CasA n=1 Tax=Corynebacterium aquatimens TaxID=1190508 RepID=A0A931E3G5_9CORY|nr:type I-E CRISPR-associated protein Cse1/CasA [Corynebacterium aquatimens]MBG6123247.1 CRISPR system Cascade subunit CasA [Corynebacterium aquatimens]WJY66424.1 CRISPR-associated protein CasA/Cse1 [Corynebacterium aquatimens]
MSGLTTVADVDTELHSVRHSYNLLNEPWIECTTEEGAKTLSIRDVFSGSEKPLSIVGDSPTQDYAVLRVLLAIYWRAHQAELARTLTSRSARMQFDWFDWFQQRREEHTSGASDRIVLEYLDQFEERFDLLHQEYPFMQVAMLDTEKAARQNVSRIVPDSEHNYFTMRTHDGRESLSFAEAARWLIHTHAYDYSGIKSGALGDPRVKGGKGYPIGTGWTGMTGGTVIRGTNLLETLILNTTQDCVHFDNSADRPVWEREPDTAAQRSAGVIYPNGPADLATWQSRRVRLFTDESEVTSVLVCNGDQIPDAGKDIFGDPMTPYRYSANKSKKGVAVFYPKAYDTQRTMWRSLDALVASQSDPDFNAKSQAPKRPRNLENLSNVADRLGKRETADVSIVSMEYGTQSSSIATMVSANIGIPLALLQDDEVAQEHRQVVRNAAEATKNAAVSLGWFCGQLEVAAGGEYVFDGYTADKLYNELERQFIDWLRGLNFENMKAEAVAWQECVRREVLVIADEAIRGAGQKALIGRVVDAAEDGSRGYVVNAGVLHRTLRHRLFKDLPLLGKDRASSEGKETALENNGGISDE